VRRAREDRCHRRHRLGNPILVSEPGVGKMTVVEGLAQHIDRGVRRHWSVG
jgi:ATP-dependent Clp protease ATP-binding subunit ClpA